MTWEQQHVPSILNVWFGGSESADAICDVLFGDVCPSGKLTATFPQNVGQLPMNYNHKNTGRPLAEGRWFEKFRSNYIDISNDPYILWIWIELYNICLFRYAVECGFYE